MSTRTLQLKTPRVFQPLLQPARYKGAYGGRGSGKSHFFAELTIEDCLRERGMLVVCIREVQKTLAQSSKRLIEGKIASLGVGSQFRISRDKIEAPGDGVIIFHVRQVSQRTPATHGKQFKKMANQICAKHGFDPLGF